MAPDTESGRGRRKNCCSPRRAALKKGLHRLGAARPRPGQGSRKRLDDAAFAPSRWTTERASGLQRNRPHPWERRRDGAGLGARHVGETSCRGPERQPLGTPRIVENPTFPPVLQRVCCTPWRCPPQTNTPQAWLNLRPAPASPHFPLEICSARPPGAASPGRPPGWSPRGYWYRARVTADGGSSTTAPSGTGWPVSSSATLLSPGPDAHGRRPRPRPLRLTHLWMDSWRTCGNLGG